MSFGGLGRLFGGNPAPSEEDVGAKRILAGVAAGGGRFERLVLTSNRRVMASVVDRGRTLRMSRALADAPDDILRALGRALTARTSAARATGRDEVRSFLASVAPMADADRPHRPRRTKPADRPHIERLRTEFDRVNDLYFGGRLPRVELRLSGRMRRRNGHFSTDPLEIAISRRLLEAAAEGEAERTLRHEMIHLWQWFEGLKPGHGSDFRRWARRLDIHPRATRDVSWTEAA